MSNLSDLLPAGAAAKQLTFTDSGSGISSKAPVVLNSDGTVSGITSTSNPVAGGTATSFGGTGATGYVYYPAIVYDSANNKMVIFYEDQGNSRYGTAVVATTSGTSISYGTPIVFNSGTTTYINATYDPDTSQTVTVYKDETNSNYGTAIVGSVSGTSISFGSEAVYASSNVYYNNVTYDTTNDKVIVAYMDYSASQYGYSAVGTVSGTSISFGTATVFESGSSNYISICYDSSTDRSVIFFQDNDDSSKGKVVVGTTSGTSISFGSAVTFEATQVYETASVFDSTANRAVVVFRTGGGDTQIVAGEVSGTSITVGTSVMVGSGAPYYGKGIAFDSNAGKTVIPFENASGNAVYRLASVSGTTPSVDAEVTFNTPGGSLGGQLYAAYNSTDRVAVFTYAPTSDYLGYATVVRPVAFDETNLTATNFVGVADSAISASAAGSVIVQGGTVSGLTDPFGTVTATYGSPTAVSAYQSESKVLAYDSANNRFVMAYKDGSNSDYGTAVVGELSGTSITWGTPVVFESATTGSNGMDIAFDSNVNRIVIAYQDQGNSSYGTAIVGSVSGTGSGSTIAFGSPTVFESADTRYLGMTFDSNDNRIVIVYSDAGNSYYATYVIGTVTTGPDAISFNTPALLNGSSATYEIDASFDATENKVLVAYTDGSYDLYVLNLAISSGSGTPGTASSFGIGSPQQRFPRCVYDSVNGKSGVAYAEGTNLPIYFSVISMSGSNVTIETRVLAGDTSDSNYFMHNIAFDASIGQLAICTRDASASKGIVYYGSISGTTSSWTTSGSLFADETILPYGVDVAYDTTANKLAFVYSPLSGSNSEAVVVTLATTTFTTGTKYYVTTSGGFSSSADTPSVNAGIAISTTSLLLNGDS